MATDAGAIRTYFAKLGFEKEIAEIYLALYTFGPQSISQLSRNAHIERTRIYRLIDQLMDSNLIEVEAHHKRGTIKAAPIANLRILISQKEQELKSLQDELGLIEQVLARNSLSSPIARVQFYEGPEAARQVRMNILNAKSDVASILFKPLGEEIDHQFADNWLEAANRQPIKFRTIYSEQLSKSYSELPAPSTGNFETRYAPFGLFPISYSTVMYDDVIATYYWQNKTIYGMELYNNDNAKSQKAIFELLWQQSQPGQN